MSEDVFKLEIPKKTYLGVGVVKKVKKQSRPDCLGH